MRPIAIACGNAFHAAAAGAFIHGNALERLPKYGVVASDIVQEIQVGGYE